MIELEVSRSVDLEEWNNQVIALNGTCFHNYEYSLFDSEVYHAEALYFVGRNEKGEAESLAVGRLRKKSVGKVSLFNTLSFGCLPACHNDDTRDVTLTEIVKYARHNNIMNLYINSFSTPFDAEILRQHRFNLKKRWEFMLRLDQTEEQIWQNISPKKRNKIRKSQKSNLIIEERTEFSDLMEFRRLQEETQRRKTEKGIAYLVASESYFRFLKTALVDKGIGKLYLAYANRGNCVAGAFFGVFNKAIYYMLSSANEDGLKLAAPDAILWSVIQDHREKGYRLFNLGGISEAELNGKPLEKSGLYVFKKSFSSTVKPCLQGSLILRPVVHRAYNLLKRIKG
jgi:hypothetical protein